MKTKDEILAALAKSPASEIRDAAMDLVADEATLLHDWSPHTAEARDLLKVWKGRESNAKAQGTPIFGAAAFVTALMALPPVDKLDQYGFQAGEGASLIWFAQGSDQFIGAVISGDAAP
jgi:hypothetical protein